MPSSRFSGRCLLSLLLAAAAGSGFLARPAEADPRPFAGIIDAAAQRHGVDPDLVHAVIAVESGYRASAQSPAGAQGLMQLMPGTQRDLGVVDAFDPRQNVDAGVAYLRRLTDEFGTVVALAAYNAGPGAARRYNGIPPYEETRAYLQAVLARNGPAAGGQAAEDHDDTADRRHAGSEAYPAEDASADLHVQAGHPTADAEAGLDSPALDEASSLDDPPRVPARAGYLVTPPGSQTGALLCDISESTGDNGPRAALDGNTLLVTWRGDADADLRLRLGLDDAQPIVRELAARPQGGEWGTPGRSLRPDFHVTSGMRRVSYQQLNPLRDLGVEITPEVMEREKWYVFRDAPSLVPGLREGDATGMNPGLPRSPDEIRTASATFETTACRVRTDSLRLEITFDGLSMGIFSGELRFTVYEGTNLVRLEAIATTEEPSVAYRYRGGLQGFSTAHTSRVTWHDVSGSPLDYRFGGPANAAPVPLRARPEIDTPWIGSDRYLGVAFKPGMGADLSTDSAPFGSRRFEIPFDAAGKSWVRLAVWDSAGNGAFVQPVWLTAR